MPTATATTAAYQTALAMLIGQRPRSRRGRVRHGLTDDALLANYDQHLRLHSHVWAALGWEEGTTPAQRLAWRMGVLVPLLRMAYEGGRQELHRLLESCLWYSTDLAQVGFADIFLPARSDKTQERPIGRFVPAPVPIDQCTAVKNVSAALLYRTGARASFCEGDSVHVWDSAAQIGAVMGCSRAHVYQTVRDYGEPSQLVSRADRATPQDGAGQDAYRRVTLPDGTSYLTRVGAPAHPTNEYVVRVTGEILELAREIEERLGPVMDPAPYEVVTDEAYRASQRAALSKRPGQDRSLKAAAVERWEEIKKALLEDKVHDKVKLKRRRQLRWLTPTFYQDHILVLRGPVYPHVADLLRRSAAAGGDTIRFELWLPPPQD